MSTDIAIIMLPPISQYATPPENQPGCELIQCSQCKKDAWISEKKRTITNIIKEKNLYIACYDCIKEKAKNEPDFFNNHSVLNL